MDFLDPKKKRAHTIRLFTGYVLVTIAILLATTLLLFAALGYGYNRNTGEVTQNGLMFIDAHPEQAKITINGQDKGETDGRFVFESGNYSVELNRDGYRTWRKNAVIEGSSIVRLVYPFLFPNQLVTSTVLPTTSAPDMVTESPDRHWILVHNPDALTTFQIVDTSTDQGEAAKTSSITVPSALFGKHTGQKLEFTEWSTDNRHVLVKYLYDGGYDYLIIDREKPAESTSVSQIMGRTYTSVTFHDKDSNEIYGHDANGGVLQLIDLESKSATTIASNVVSFWPYKDTNVIYTTTQGAVEGKVIVHMRDGQSDYAVRELAIGPKYLLNVAEFDSDMYLTVGSSSDGKVYVYKNPLTALKKKDVTKNIPFLLLKLDNPDAVTFSANARFIAVQSGGKFELYDIEAKQQHRYDTGLTVATGQLAKWMDGHRLMLVSEGKLRIFDFDGLNMQTLTATDPAYLPLFDRDFNALYTYGPQASDATKTGLSRTELLVKKN